MIGGGMKQKRERVPTGQRGSIDFSGGGKWTPEVLKGVRWPPREREAGATWLNKLGLNYDLPPRAPFRPFLSFFHLSFAKRRRNITWRWIQLPSGNLRSRDVFKEDRTRESFPGLEMTDRSSRSLAKTVTWCDLQTDCYPLPVSTEH